MLESSLGKIVILEPSLNDTSAGIIAGKAIMCCTHLGKPRVLELLFGKLLIVVLLPGKFMNDEFTFCECHRS